MQRALWFCQGHTVGVVKRASQETGQRGLHEIHPGLHLQLPGGRDSAEAVADATAADGGLRVGAGLKGKTAQSKPWQC